jgi:hypothetical protein
MNYLLDLSKSHDAIYQAVGLVLLPDDAARIMMDQDLVTVAHYESDGEGNPAFATLTPKA